MVGKTNANSNLVKRIDKQTTISGNAGNVTNYILNINVPAGMYIGSIMPVIDTGNAIPHVQSFNGTYDNTEDWSATINIAVYYIYDVTSAKLSVDVLAISNCPIAQ